MKEETYLKLKKQKKKVILLALIMTLTGLKSIIKNSTITIIDEEHYENIEEEQIVYSIEKSINYNYAHVDKMINYDYICQTPSYSPTVLEARKGNNIGPEAFETFYDLPMNVVVVNLEKLYGFSNLEYKVRCDGVKILSGTLPNGKEFKDLVMVAADVRDKNTNPKGTYERGDLVNTSLGKGIVVDACGEAKAKRRYNKGNHYDIATAWQSYPFSSITYGKKTIETPPGINITPDKTQKLILNFDDMLESINTLNSKIKS